MKDIPTLKLPSKNVKRDTTNNNFKVQSIQDKRTDAFCNRGRNF